MGSSVGTAGRRLVQRMRCSCEWRLLNASQSNERVELLPYVYIGYPGKVRMLAREIPIRVLEEPKPKRGGVCQLHNATERCIIVVGEDVKKRETVELPPDGQPPSAESFDCCNCASCMHNVRRTKKSDDGQEVNTRRTSTPKLPNHNPVSNLSFIRPSIQFPLDIPSLPSHLHLHFHLHHLRPTLHPFVHPPTCPPWSTASNG